MFTCLINKLQLRLLQFIIQIMYTIYPVSITCLVCYCTLKFCQTAFHLTTHLGSMSTFPFFVFVLKQLVKTQLMLNPNFKKTKQARFNGRQTIIGENGKHLTDRVRLSILPNSMLERSECDFDFSLAAEELEREPRRWL